MAYGDNNNSRPPSSPFPKEVFMNAEEWAEKFTPQSVPLYNAFQDTQRRFIKRLVADAVLAAVADEREACAKIAEAEIAEELKDVDREWYRVSRAIARKIRERN